MREGEEEEEVNFSFFLHLTLWNVKNLLDSYHA
jgi:hypothetical protein